MKICTYKNSCMFDTIFQISVQLANSEKSQDPKPPSLFDLRLGGKRGKTLKTPRQE